MAASSSFLRFQFSLHLVPNAFLDDFQKDDRNVISSAPTIRLVDQNVCFSLNGHGEIVQNRLDGGLRNEVRQPVGTHEKKVPSLRTDRTDEHVDLCSKAEHPRQDILDQEIAFFRTVNQPNALLLRLHGAFLRTLDQSAMIN